MIAVLFGGLLTVRIVADYDDFGTLTTEGPEDLRSAFMVWLGNAYGPFGHGIDPPHVRPSELDHALLSAPSWLGVAYIDVDREPLPSPPDGCVF